MATFISYQYPKTVTPATQDKTFRPPAPHKLPSVPHGLPAPRGVPAFILSERDWQRAGGRTLEDNGMLDDYKGVEVVDLTGPDQEDPILTGGPPSSSRAVGHSPGADTHVSSSPGDTRDMPIVLNDDDELDDELGAAASDGGSDRTLTDTPPANRNDPHSSVPAVLAKSVPNGRAGDSATDGANSGQSLRDRSVKYKRVGNTEQSRPSMHREHDRSSSNGKLTECPEQDVPASASRTHDVFTEFEKTFGTEQMKQAYWEQKRRNSSSHRINSVRDGSQSPSEQSVCDEHQVQDPDRTISPSPTEVASDGHYATYLTNTERDGVSPSAQNEGRQEEPARSTPTSPNLPSQKRPGTSAGLDTPLPKRPRRSTRMTREKAKEAEKTLERLGSHGQKTLYHAYPRHFRDKDWRVEDLNDVFLAEDGSVQYVVRWEPSVVAEGALCEALQERGVQLFKEKYGAKAWEKRLEMQGRLIDLPRQRK